MRWATLFRGRLAPGEPIPSPERLLPGQQSVSSPSLDDQMRLLAWQSPPLQSHVMDCALPIPIAGRRDGARQVTTYAIYLPADYLAHPERRRAVLLLVSGGNGNRTRWFLTPSSRRGLVPGTGGLEVRRRVDAWAAAHPSMAPPLVIGLDGSSPQFPNGMSVFIGSELQDHVRSTYLPSYTREEIPFGVVAISSGAVEVALALRRNVGAFQTVGFLSPYTHEQGVHLATTFGTEAERTALFRAFAARVREGRLAMRFSIGNRDDHYTRTRAWYDLLVREGVFARVERPTFGRCIRADLRPSQGHCVSMWPGLDVYPEETHNYHALLPSFPVQFEWALDTLGASVSSASHHHPSAALRVPSDRSPTTQTP